MRRGLMIVGLVVAACQPAEASFSCTAAAHDQARHGDTLLVLGDWGAGPGTASVAAEMQRAAAGRDVAAVVTTGDNFYLNDGDEAFCGPFEWLVDAGIPVWAAWGNHDLDEPARHTLMTEMLGVTERRYARAVGEWTVLLLDSNQVRDDGQRAWLEEQVAAANVAGRQVMVSFHHPALSCGRHGSSEAVGDEWVPLFEQHGVDLVLNGHDHHYQRFERGGVTYVVSGAGGRSMRPLQSCREGTPAPLATEHDEFSFLVLELHGPTLHLRSITADGDVIDTTDIGS